MSEELPVVDEEMKLLAEYRVQRLELQKHSQVIADFIGHAKGKGIDLRENDFKYYQTIGIVAEKKDLTLLLTELVEDKEGLLLFEELKTEYQLKKYISGYLFAENFMMMPHPFFRRGFSGHNNFAPKLVENLWRFDAPDIEMSLAIDSDRVRVDGGGSLYMEMDTWYGAPFAEDIQAIPDGTSKLRPPLDIKKEFVSFFFDDAYSLDTMWKTKGEIKSFQAEEFKDESVTIEIETETYYPVRYIHAEHDNISGEFRHFDGAVHLYTAEEYFARRDLDFDHVFKTDNQIKPKSRKLFKMNGSISVEMWVNYCCYFCSGNPLIIEYFTGDYPDALQQNLERIRAKNHA